MNARITQRETLQPSRPTHDLCVDLREGEEVAEDLRADDDHDDHAARVRRAHAAP